MDTLARREELAAPGAFLTLKQERDALLATYGSTADAVRAAEDRLRAAEARLLLARG
jgi:hypothetical protein